MKEIQKISSTGTWHWQQDRVEGRERGGACTCTTILANNKKLGKKLLSNVCILSVFNRKESYHPPFLSLRHNFSEKQISKKKKGKVLVNKYMSFVRVTDKFGMAYIDYLFGAPIHRKSKGTYIGRVNILYST